MPRPKANSLTDEWTILLPAGDAPGSQPTAARCKTDPFPFQRESLFPRGTGQVENPPAFDMIIQTQGDSPVIEKKMRQVRLTKCNMVILRADGADFDVHAFYSAFLDTLRFAMQDRRAAGLELRDFSIFVVTHTEPEELFSYLQKEYHWRRAADPEGVFFFLDGPFRMQFIITTQIDPALLPSSEDSKEPIPTAECGPSSGTAGHDSGTFRASRAENTIELPRLAPRWGLRRGF